MICDDCQFTQDNDGFPNYLWLDLPPEKKPKCPCCNSLNIERSSGAIITTLTCRDCKEFKIGGKYRELQNWYPFLSR
jgi:hypothetical protein